MKNLPALGLMLFVLSCNAFAGATPHGFMELGDLEKAKAMAAKEGKLVAIVAKGSDDGCPRCAAALDNGTKAVKSDCVLVFSRVSKLRSENGLPEAVKSAAANATDGAWVTFYIFDPAVEKLIVQAGRDELESNKTKIRAFKNTVDTARKDLTGK